MKKRSNKGVPIHNTTIWVEVIETGKRDLGAVDLRARDWKLTLEASEYFFVRPVNGDEHDITTFTGLMTASGINPDTAAKKIFDDLSQVNQRHVCLLLRDAGYKVRPTYLRTDKFTT